MTTTTQTQSSTSDLLLEKATKILNQNENESSLNLSLSCSLITLQYKAENLKLYNPKNKSPLADYVLIVTANNTTQAIAMAEKITLFLRRNKVEHRVEGLNSSQWILIDISDVLVHIFLPETRDMYQLDQLYLQIPKVAVPEEFYSQVSELVKPNNSNSNYLDYL